MNPMITSAQPQNRILIPASQRCYAILRKMLICAQIAPGTRLAEVEWSERLNVQRAALREAMVLLAHDGLLIRRESGGFFTPRLDEIDTDHLMESRAVLEVGALKITAEQKLPAEAFQPLIEICNTMQYLHETDMTMGFCESDFLFHQKLLELSGNPILVKLFSHSAQLIFFVSPISAETRKNQELNTIREHCEILRLLQAGEASQACEELEQHLIKAKLGMKSMA